jgi:hypothetical protein
MTLLLAAALERECFLRPALFPETIQLALASKALSNVSDARIATSVISDAGLFDRLHTRSENPEISIW